ncbi:MAG: NTP transferase domain-containing protein, partial [Actinobacteria bacterium]|nr:NTP transferase domain-containing protein [Actinomycetota bacterium]
MKGVILAGGLGTRLMPCTKVTNKHLLPVYNRPMIYYPLETMVKGGLKDIMIVTGGNNAGDFLRLLGNGKEFGLKDISYTYQEGEGGIADALKLAENFVDNDKVVVMLGDNIIKDDISGPIADFEKQEEGAKIFLKEVKDPERFGVAEIREGRVVNIEEKPANPKSN